MTQVTLVTQCHALPCLPFRHFHVWQLQTRCFSFVCFPICVTSPFFFNTIFSRTETCVSCSDTPAFFSVPTPRTSWGWILVQVSLLGGGDDFSVYSFFFSSSQSWLRCCLPGSLPYSHILTTVCVWYGVVFVFVFAFLFSLKPGALIIIAAFCCPVVTLEPLTSR